MNIKCCTYIDNLSFNKKFNLSCSQIASQINKNKFIAIKKEGFPSL